MPELDICKLASICLTHLASAGFEVGESSDYAALEAQMPAMGKPLVSPTMRAQMNDFTAARAFWITMSLGDRLVAVMGVRLDELGREPAAEFWRRAFGRHYRSDIGTEVRLNLPEVVQTIRGRIAYMGDLYFSESIRGSRPNLMCFLHLAHALCFLKWQHDWTYAFHRREDVLSGYTDRYGFNNRWPGAQIWTNPPDYRSDEEYLSVLSRAEFEHKATYYARNPDLLIRADPRAMSKAALKN